MHLGVTNHVQEDDSASKDNFFIPYIIHVSFDMVMGWKVSLIFLMTPLPSHKISFCISLSDIF